MTKELLIHENKTYKAVLWNMQIIGEASSHISEETKEKNPKINWRDIRAFRNIVTHEYFGIDPIVLWDVVQNHIPALKNNY